MSVVIPDFVAQFYETADSVRARYDNDAGMGLDLTDGDWFQLLTEPAVQENVRQWASLNDVLQNAFVLYAVGQWLDYKAAEFRITREAATFSEGTVTFTGTPGKLIPSGTGVVASTTSDAQPTVRFFTQVDATIGGGGTIDVAVTAENSGSIYNVAANAIVLIDGNISGITSVNNANPTTTGSDIESDDALRQRILDAINTPQAAGATGDYVTWLTAIPGVGAVTVTPLWNGNNTVKGTLLDTENNPVDQAVMDIAQAMLTGSPVVLDPTAAPSAGAGSAGAITGTYYYQYTFVDHNSCETKPGPVSTSVIVTSKQINVSAIAVSSDATVVSRNLYRSTSPTGPFNLVTNIANNTATTYTDNAATLSGGALQAPMTNNTTGWMGVAPVGAIVSIDTPVDEVIAVSATISPVSGYSLDGTSGTTALRAAIQASVTAYMSKLAPGEDVIYQHVIAALFIPGVYDVSSVVVNGGSSNVSIPTSTVAVPGTITLS